MPPKKSQRSAMWYYADECIKNRTCTASSVKEAIDAVYPAYKALSPAEKSVYERKYAAWWNAVKNEKNQPVIKKENIHYEKKTEERETLRHDLLAYLHKLSTIRNSKDEIVENKAEKTMTNIKNQSWYFIKFQSFCKSSTNPIPNTHYNPYYVLAEVALVEYSIEDGIKNVYHEFIIPNQIPLGYRSQCMDTSRDEHKIPLDSFSMARKSYKQIYEEISEFVKQKYENNYYAPLFCMKNDIKETEFAMQFLYDMYSKTINNESPFAELIFDIESLMGALFDFCKLDCSDASCNEMLNSYEYDYSPNSRCQFHEEEGTIKCSLAFVKKYAYIFSDHMCKAFNVKPTKCHLPVRDKIEIRVMQDDFRSSLCSSRSSSNSGLNRMSTKKIYKSSIYVNYEDDKNYFKEDDEFDKSTENDTDSNYSRVVSSETNSQASSNRFQFASRDIRLEHSQQQKRTATGNRRLVSDKFESIGSHSIISSSEKTISDVSNRKYEYEDTYEASSTISMSTRDDFNDASSIASSSVDSSLISSTKNSVISNSKKKNYIKPSRITEQDENEDFKYDDDDDDNDIDDDEDEDDNNDGEEDEDDDNDFENEEDGGWKTVSKKNTYQTKHRFPTIPECDNRSVTSDKSGSTITNNENSSVKSGFSLRLMGRGKGLIHKH